MKEPLSKAEELFLQSGIEDDIRQDGRGRLDYRDFTIETGVLPHANGSALLNLGSSRILVGVKLEIGAPLPDKLNFGRILCSVDWSKAQSISAEARQEVEKTSASLSRQLENSLTPSRDNKGGIDLEKLCIIPEKSCWIVYIDALVLGFGGNLVDTISIATRAALRNTKIPKTIVTGEGESLDFEISDDPMDCERFNTQSIPISISLTKVGNYFIIDPSPEEEACMSMQLTISVDHFGNFCSISKSGKGGIDPSNVIELLQSVKKIGQALIQRIDSVLEEEEIKQIPSKGFLDE